MTTAPTSATAPSAPTASSAPSTSSAHDTQLAPRTQCTQRPRALVVGSTFGLQYARGLAHPDSPVELAGIIARGSDRSRALADTFGVPFYQLPDLTEPATSLSAAGLPEVELACVVVRSAVSGGPGDDIARFFLQSGTSVLQEHPVHPTSIVQHLHTARAATPSDAVAATGLAHPVYAVNAFYPTLPTVQNLVRCVSTLRQQSRIVAVEVCGSIHIFYALLAILAEMLPGLPRLILQREPLAQQGVNKQVVNLTLDWEGTPVDIRLYNRMAPVDPDNHSQPLFGCVVECEDGELVFDHVHGPVRWMPRSHYVDGAFTHSADTPSRMLVGEDEFTDAVGHPFCEFTGRQLMEEVWPRGVMNRVGALAAATCQQEAFGQRDLALAKLWQEVAAEIPHPVAIESVPPRQIVW